jgi:hypothetical protein
MYLYVYEYIFIFVSKQIRILLYLWICMYIYVTKVNDKYITKLMISATELYLCVRIYELYIIYVQKWIYICVHIYELYIYIWICLGTYIYVCICIEMIIHVTYSIYLKWIYVVYIRKRYVCEFIYLKIFFMVSLYRILICVISPRN